MCSYLTTDPLFQDRFDKVFLLHDWPDLPSDLIDDGIDLVGIDRDGGICAIQCKFYDRDQEVYKPKIDSFLSAASRKFFTSRLIIATTDRWNRNALRILANQDSPVQRLGLSDLIDENGLSQLCTSVAT